MKRYAKLLYRYTFGYFWFHLATLCFVFGQPKNSKIFKNPKDIIYVKHEQATTTGTTDRTIEKRIKKRTTKNQKQQKLKDENRIQKIKQKQKYCKNFTL